MLGIIHQKKLVKVLTSWLTIAALALGIVSCGDRAASSRSPASGFSPQGQVGLIGEVAPPKAIQQLRSTQKAYQPQVKLLNPKADEVLSDTNVSVRFQVKDFLTFKNPDFGIGPHLNVILDNQPYIEVYEPDQPLILEGLSPGTHTLRVFASTPWNESWKTEGAYAQTTFHVFTKTAENSPIPNQPLLTYNSPQGKYGAEPILLDFYLSTLTASPGKAQSQGDRWQARATVNGQSFLLDKWQPIYLKGFKPGKNWLRLELLDKEGKPVNNVFNDTLRLIDYEPNAQDSLSKLVRDEISAAEAGGIVDRNYTYQPPPPEPTFIPTPVPSTSLPTEEIAPSTPTVEETPEIAPSPEVEETPTVVTPAPAAPSPKGGFFSRFRQPAPSPSVVTPPAVEEIPSLTPEVEELPLVAPTPAALQTPTVEATPEVGETPAPAAPSPKGGFFSRFRQPAPSPSVITPPPAEEIPSLTPEVEELPLVAPTPAALQTPTVEATPEVGETPAPAAPSPKGGFFSRFRQPAASPSIVTPVPTEEIVPSTPAVEETPEIAPAPEVGETTPPAAPSPKGGFFSRFRQPAASPSIVTPVPTEEIVPSTPAVEETPEIAPAPEVGETTPPAAPSPKGGFFSRFRQPMATPNSVTVPEEILETPNPESVKSTSPAVATPKTPEGQKFKIIQAPSDADIPSYYLQKSTSPTPTTEGDEEGSL